MNLWFFWGLNFSPRGPSYLSDELIVSRFSSLSGCLNPKVKAFLPPVYIPFTGGFLFLRSREPRAHAVATFVDALSRDARKKRGAITTQAARGVGDKRRLRATRKLVGLR